MLEILTLPKKSLHEKSTELDLALLSDKSFQSWLKEFNETMHLKDGVGLAAPQVGRNIRVCAINRAGTKLIMDDKHEPTMPHDLILINPVWKKISRKQKKDLEGCLSVPGFYGKVKRYHDILVETIDEKGKKMSKSIGNVITPDEIMDQVGADATRWYLYTLNEPGDFKSISIQVSECSWP